MRKLLYIILISILMSAVMSCGRSEDKRLVLADSLMWKAPDSSLAILNAINRDSLTSDENRAYHALLLTQARFRVDYYDYPSDSIINTALDYFGDNHNREHYTRSLLYKGAYYEFSTNQPVEAMKWYKQAEENADTTDYRNLAQINMRMAILYFKHYAGNNLDLEKFKKAAYYYKKLRDKRMTLVATMYVANVYRITERDTSKLFYNQAQALAIELRDSNQLFQCFAEKALLYLVDSSYIDAKNCMLQALSLSSSSVENSHYFILSEAYANLGFADSAEYYLNKADLNSCNSYDSVMFYRTRKEIALARGDFANATQYEKIYLNLSDSLEYNKEKYALSQFENDFDSKRIASKRKESTTWRTLTFALVSFFVLSLIILISFHFKKKRDYLKLIRELRHDNFAHYEQFGNSISDFDSGLSEAMGAKLKVFEEIMTGAYNPQQDYKSNEIAHRMTPIDDNDTRFWNGLFAYLNYKHDGIMDKISSQFPQLTVPDLNFIALMCCDFSSTAIAVCKRYRNIDSVRSRRMKIRDKMGIEGTLTKYLETLKTTAIDTNQANGELNE